MVAAVRPEVCRLNGSDVATGVALDEQKRLLSMKCAHEEELAYHAPIGLPQQCCTSTAQHLLPVLEPAVK